MAFLSALRCVACGAAGLQASANVLDCACCGRSYPVIADVPLMCNDVTVGRGPLLEPAVVQTILQAMALPVEIGHALHVRRASGVRARYGDRLVAAEGTQFLRRVHASGFPIPAQAMAAKTVPDSEPPGDGQPQCRWLLDYIPRAMPPGEACLANIRFENTGTAAMRHTGDGQVAAAFAWTNEAGDTVTSEDYRTPLPADVPPGHALTLPVRLIAPPEAGRYGLTVRLVMEGVRWLEPAYGPLRVAIRPGAAFVPPPHWQLNAHRPSDYVADQARGAALLHGWLERQPGYPALRLLEIGGNAKPVLSQFPGEVYNVDVDLFGLQVGQVIQRVRGAPVRIACADAYRLPFAEQFFDAIVMFASLHHMPDPAALLRRLRSHLRPGGFIGAFCEPIGQIWPGAASEEFRAELRQGVNEQGFSLAEYAQIFAGAGLEVAELVADHNSLKVRLVQGTPVG